MPKPACHILVCLSFRGLESKGKCAKQGSAGLLAYLDGEISSRGLNAMVSSTSCLQFCEQGPVLVVYPQGWWYGGVDSEDKLDDILDALEQSRACEEYLLA